MALLTNLVNNNPNYYDNSYISPKSPIELNPSRWNSIPFIDLNQGDDSLVGEIKQTCELYGMFKVSNHGISDEIITSAMRSATEFYNLSPEKIANQLLSLRNRDMLYAGSVAHAAGLERAHYWRDNMLLAWNTIRLTKDWPKVPYSFRTNVWNFGDKLESLENRLVRLIAEALDLDDDDYFDRGLRRNAYLSINNFPPCTRPEMTLGMAEHCDPGILMISLLGNVPGTQIWIDGEWKQVAPCMNTLLVTVGNVLQVVSNKKFQAPKHREVVNSREARLTISYLSQPGDGHIVKPARKLKRIDGGARYKNFPYKEYYDLHLTENAETSTLLQRRFELT